MAHCKTCVYWRTHRGTWHHGAGFDIAPVDPNTYEALSGAQIRALYGHFVAYCTHPKLLFYQRPAHDGAAVYDGSQYDASLVTGEDFGCVLHTAAETDHAD